MGCRPKRCSPRSLQMSSAEAPSQIWELLAGVSTPFANIACKRLSLKGNLKALDLQVKTYFKA